jgi:CBS domain
MRTSDGRSGAMYGFLACTARQFMTRTVTTVEPQTTMSELGGLFEKHDFNAFPVMEDGKVLGIVTKFDFLRAFAFTSSQAVPHYDECEAAGRGHDDRGDRACRPSIAIDAGSTIDGESQGTELSGDDSRWSIGRYDLSRGCHARPQRDNAEAR